MKILAIETSCDETCAAVINDGLILSNIVWSQIALHKEYGGVMPSVAKRAHEENVDNVISKAIQDSGLMIQDMDVFAVTAGPGLAIALEVGIRKAKDLANKYNKPLIAVNHIEGHVLSSLIDENFKLQTSNYKFPSLGLVVSGGHTELILIKEIGQYQIIAQTMDDALGEALDKAARMLGLGYPGGALLEKRAALGDPKKYNLPRPMAGREDQNSFSYSGLKTALWRLTENKNLSEQDINDWAASFQRRAFEHLIRVTRKTIQDSGFMNHESGLLVGGGVAANNTLRQQLIDLGSELDLNVHFAPRKLFGDNAAMIGVVAHFKALRQEFTDPNKLDRTPRWRIDQTLV